MSLLDVDTWPIFVRFDQNADIQNETAAQIAAMFQETGPYDMIYFDGAEDVHAPFWFHCANVPQEPRLPWYLRWLTRDEPLQ